MASFRKEQIGISDAARLLGIKVGELRVAILEEKTILGVRPPRPRHFGGDARSGGWVFMAGDVMDAADEISRLKMNRIEDNGDG